MKLNIAILVRAFPTTSESFIVTQIAYLLQAGHEVTIYATQQPPAGQVRHKLVEELDLMSRVIYRPEMPDKPLPRLLQALKLQAANAAHTGKILKALNVPKFGWLAASLDLLFTAAPFFTPRHHDIIHCHFGPMGVKAAALKDLGLLSGRIMVTFHGYDVMDRTFLKRKGYYDLMIRRADLFTANSNYTMQRAVQVGIPAEKLVRLPMGLDTDKFRRRSAGERESREIIKFISVGRLVEVKGFEFAIRAFANVVHTLGIKNVRYAIVGSGPLQAELEQLIAELSLQPYVQLAGSKTQEEVQQLFEEADVFVLPGINAANGAAEAQGLVIQEAQAMELPVIVSDVGGMPDGMIDGKTGFLVPEKDVRALSEKIVLLAQNAALREQMGREGRQFVVANFDYRSLGQQLEALYFRMLDKT